MGLYYLSVCQLIADNIADKNPKTDSGWTPLDLAAKNGHLSVCQLIVENVKDKNPKDWRGRTPLDLAISRKHASIQKLFEDAL